MMFAECPNCDQVIDIPEHADVGWHASCPSCRQGVTLGKDAEGDFVLFSMMPLERGPASN